MDWGLKFWFNVIYFKKLIMSWDNFWNKGDRGFDEISVLLFKLNYVFLINKIVY